MSSDSTERQDLSLRKTPLYPCHEKASARFTEFAGWYMPVQFTGLVDEHLTVRSHVGLFDVSHMGEVSVRGPDAVSFLQYLTTNDIERLKPGTAQYCLLLNKNGGVVDDLIVYQVAQDDYLLCTNAVNTGKDFAWLNMHCKHQVSIEDCSDRFAQVAVQGPAARALLCKLLAVSDSEYSPESFPAFSFRTERTALETKPDVPLLVACTGYTGEDGFEVFCPADFARAFWNRLLELGAEFGVKPIGLGARDTLRLEVCYPLHGHELRDDVSAIGCGVNWSIKMKKGDFIGRDALLRQKEKGVSHTIVGLEVVGRGIVRAENKLFDGKREIGWVSSGTKTPTVNKAIGLALVFPQFSQPGTVFEAEVRGKRVAVKVVKRPFYKRS